ncbi:ACR3 family arsenite efflux transporter [Methanococcus maripaludis]|uniref:ACR3 family arsenite transporter n=2 Tax=Methanococcus maripaludis TaxID=39152 RepID=A0A7J9PDJ9_METMI|nr:ACR3 family arsenite efflux transporter [Methanococcus maripaludis]MBA2860806.1 ACR3 family arsenite transporter [Methanococcus maripaludis]
MANGIGFFEKYLSVWVFFCIVFGILLGNFIPEIPRYLSEITVSQVNLPIAVLVWFMIYPMMVKIDFSAVKNLGKSHLVKGLSLTWIVNWLIKPFSMFLIAYFFLVTVFSQYFGLLPLELAKEYVAGAILLGAAPCTAMVFVWSHLSKGDPFYTLLQVSTNDLIILLAFAPIVGFLMGLSNIPVPYDTLILSVVLFVVIPLIFGYYSRKYVLKNKGKKWFENIFIPKLNNISIFGLLLTLILLFSFQGDLILNNPLYIVLIAIPLIIQTYFIFGVSYIWGFKWKLPHNVCAPASFIGASNFFELAVAVAISLFGIESGAALATTVGVLVEVPVMLSLVKIANQTKNRFKL